MLCLNKHSDAQITPCWTSVEVIQSPSWHGHSCHVQVTTFLKSYGSIVCCACSSRSSWAYTAGGTSAFQHNATWCRQVDTWTCLMHSEYVWCAELNSYAVSHFLHACLACGYCFKKIWFMVVVVGYLSPRVMKPTARWPLHSVGSQLNTQERARS